MRNDGVMVPMPYALASVLVAVIKSLAAGKMGMGTRQVGDLIAKLVS